MSTAVFGGGCFWCTEAVFQMLKGVQAVEPGYAGGSKENPTYEDVSTGTTGHAEVIRITYDEHIISYSDLLTVFFGTHDPTMMNRQGNDVGEQYRSVILYTTTEERLDAERMIADLQASLKDGSRIVTHVAPLQAFYPAEEYHRNYYKTNASAPYCQLIIEPKIEKVREKFMQLTRTAA